MTRSGKIRRILQLGWVKPGKLVHFLYILPPINVYFTFIGYTKITAKGEGSPSCNLLFLIDFEDYHTKKSMAQYAVRL
ncbi:MAG: hypothetical protein DBY25_03385 [Clostridiales bacterium]|nr:MAG: hypothetical protein DBY25_03385 [Clostridiales bacterium]